MSFNEPILLEIAGGVYAVNEFGLATVFVVEGTQRALVIDTGMGYCDMRAIVEKITAKPYTVVLTHGHLDHAGGWDLFDEVWLHPADRERAECVTAAERIASGQRMRGLEGDPDTWDYGPENVREWKRLPKIRDLADGMEFDLGDRKIICVHTPGHSAGSCSFIDPARRLLFSGDACNVSLRVTDGGPETALKGLMRLKTLEGLFDRNFNGHMAYASGMTHISMPQTTLDDCIAAMRLILDGKAKPVTRTWSKYSGGWTASFIYGAVTVTWRVDGEEA